MASEIAESQRSTFFSCHCLLGHLPSFSDLVGEDSHGRAVLLTHCFGISDLKATDAGLRVFPGDVHSHCCI